MHHSNYVNGMHVNSYVHVLSECAYVCEAVQFFNATQQHRKTLLNSSRGTDVLSTRPQNLPPPSVSPSMYLHHHHPSLLTLV